MIIHRWQDWVNLFVQIAEWLALRVDGASTLQFHLACEPIRAIAADNPEVHRALRNAMAIVKEKGLELHSSGLGEYAEQILACLESYERRPG